MAPHSVCRLDKDSWKLTDNLLECIHATTNVGWSLSAAVGGFSSIGSKKVCEHAGNRKFVIKTVWKVCLGGLSYWMRRFRDGHSRHYISRSTGTVQAPNVPTSALFLSVFRLSMFTSAREQGYVIASVYVLICPCFNASAWCPSYVCPFSFASWQV